MATELDFKTYRKKLGQFIGAYPEVVAATMTRLAVAGDGAQRRMLGKEFTLRNKWTAGSVGAWKAKPNKDIGKINAVTGSRSNYLAIQEEGGIERNADGTPTKTTPSAASRGKNWTKPILARYRWKALQKQKAVFALKPRSGGGAVLSKKRQKKRRALTEEALFMRKGKRLVKVRVINKTPIHLKATHWHERGLAPIAKDSVVFAAFASEAEKALMKLGANNA